MDNSLGVCETNLSKGITPKTEFPPTGSGARVKVVAGLDPERLLGDARPYIQQLEEPDSNLKNWVEIIHAALPPNGVSTKASNKMLDPKAEAMRLEEKARQAETVEGSKLKMRPDEKDFFDESQSLRKEKEHKGEVAEVDNLVNETETNSLPGTDIHLNSFAQTKMISHCSQKRPDVKPDMVHSPYLVQSSIPEAKFTAVVATSVASLRGQPGGDNTSSFATKLCRYRFEVNTIAPAVNIVCLPSRTDEKILFSGIESLRKEKEHEGEATGANSSPEYEGKTLPKPSNFQIDGSSSVPPHRMRIRANIYAPPDPQCRKEEELQHSENSILSYIVTAVYEFEARYKYWTVQVQEGILLSNTQELGVSTCPPPPHRFGSVAHEDSCNIFYPWCLADPVLSPEPTVGILYRADIRDSEMPYPMGIKKLVDLAGLHHRHLQLESLTAKSSCG
ncbi:hypothetical protein AAG570_006140 [Ranatra chinensis]|uniref:Uncharacterized protein n=1 Tax=Ranatra chinensis TaxID=642074 RepID=A0ABD0XX63_9HEMI